MFVSRVNPVTGRAEWTLRDDGPAARAEHAGDDDTEKAEDEDEDEDGEDEEEEDGTDDAVHASMHLVRGHARPPVGRGRTCGAEERARGVGSHRTC